MAPQHRFGLLRIHHHADDDLGLRCQRGGRGVGHTSVLRKGLGHTRACITYVHLIARTTQRVGHARTHGTEADHTHALRGHAVVFHHEPY